MTSLLAPDVATGGDAIATAHHYAVFGGVLCTPYPFPELVPIAPAAPTWTLRVATAPPAGDETPLGERALGLERYWLSRIASGVRLTYSHAGSFDVTDAGATITWYPSSDAHHELARWIVLGPALALALEATGHLCLHGSAVAAGGQTIAFVAPKYHGKSTLALALVRAGARYVGDDTLAVTPEATPRLRPGVGSARLWEDTAQALRVGELCQDVVTGVKTTAIGFSADVMMEAPLPLGAVYLLAPVPDGVGVPAARRTRLATPAAAVTLAQQAKLPDSLVGLRAAGQRLRRAAQVATTVPVYSLALPRSFARLEESVAGILRWHAGAEA